MHYVSFCSSFIQIANDLSGLEAKTRASLPESMRKAWDRAQKVTTMNKVAWSVGAILTAAASAGVVGGSPVPFSDAALLVPIQGTMVATILFIWGLSKSDIAKITAWTALQQTAVSFAGLGLANLLKLIPGVGSIAGAIINAGVAATVTASMGVIYTGVLFKFQSISCNYCPSFSLTIRGQN
jgi:uncharacterized protein (DUF697 family)